MRGLSSRLRPCCSSGWTSSKVLSGAFLPANNGEGKHCVQIGVSVCASDSALGARNAAGSMYIALLARGTCFRCARAGSTASQPPENAIARPNAVTFRLFICPALSGSDIPLNLTLNSWLISCYCMQDLYSRILRIFKIV